jgi:lipopolysaccharide export system permease protein
MLNTLQRDILRRHVGPFLFCLITLHFLLLMQFLILHIDKLVGKGLDTSIIIELILYQLAYMLVLAAPMSVLAATLMAYGRFAELNELTAIKAAGVKPMQLMKPVLFSAAILAVFLTWFSNEVLPEANFKARSLFLDIRMKKPGFDLNANTFYDGIEGYTFLVRDISADSDTLFDVTIFQEATPSREQAVIKARFGQLSSDDKSFALQLDLYDGSVFRYLPGQRSAGDRYEESLFEKHRIRFDMSDMAFSRTNPDLRRRDDRTMSSQAMRVINDSLHNEIARDLALVEKRYPPLQLLDSIPKQRDLYRDVKLFHVTSSDSITRSNITHRFEPETDLDLVSLRQLKFLESQSVAALEASTSIRTTIGNVQNTEGSVRWKKERIAQYQVEIFKKVSIPVGCIIFVLIGAPLGMLTRKGNIGFNVIVCTVLFTYYWITVIQGEKLADRLVISPFLGMWFGNITLGILGIILVIKVTSEKRISDLWKS